MIGVVDYGRGNLHSVLKALRHTGVRSRVVRLPNRLGDCAGIIIPGVGSFRDAMARLRAGDMDAAIWNYARDGRPVLGICLGMQILLSQGLEGGAVQGLDLIGGHVRRLAAGNGIKVPHTGWNEVVPLRTSPLTRAIPEGSYFYFTHSFAAFPVGPIHWLGKTTHGETFASVIGSDNVLGVQFHPEKSGNAGLQLLRNFVSMTKGGVDGACQAPHRVS